jgi:Immunity protein Imm1
MTIITYWADFEPGTIIERISHETVLATPDDVQTLIDGLARPSTSEASLVHTKRPKEHNKLFDTMENDHQVIIAVWRGHGYMEYSDPKYYSQFAGDPASPEWHTSSSGYFYPGTGVSLDTLVKAVSEFLVTAERPTCVQWRECGSPE